MPETQHQRSNHLRLIAAVGENAARWRTEPPPAPSPGASQRGRGQTTSEPGHRGETEGAPLRPSPGRTGDRCVLRDASDDELMLMTSAGARLAFDELIRRYQERAIAVAFRQTGQHAVALEIAQESFVDVLEAAPTYQPRGKFGGFLFRIVVNRCRMEFRKRCRDRRAQDTSRIGSSPELGDSATGLDVLLARERERRLNAAARQLSQPLLEVISLWTEGFRDRQIAEILGTPEGTVRRRRFDAIERLRQLLEGE